MNKKTTAILTCLVVVIAFFFRFYHVNELPGGLFPDEAANGLDINLMEQGHLQPFYERGNGREALFFYMIWGFVKAIGRSPLAHHATSALVGTLAVILCYLVTKKLFAYLAATYPANSTTKEKSIGAQPLRINPSIIALLAAFFMAVSSWHVVLSRTAFRANLIPLCTGLFLWALISVPQAKTKRSALGWSLLAGASFALGFYSYIAYRIMIPLVGILVLWPLLGQLANKNFWNTIRTYFLPAIGIGLAFIIVISPIAHYFYTHPGSFVGRSGQVSVFNPELNKGDLVGTVLEVSRLSFLAYFTHGDLNWRHNISGYPFLSPLVSPFFALGLLIILYGALRYLFTPRRTEYFPHFLLAGWFFAFLIPVITTGEGIPHGLRSIGTIPAVFIIAAFGLYEACLHALRAIHHHPTSNLRLELLLKKALWVLMACYLIALPVQTYAWYFIGAASSPENYFAFRSDLTIVSDWLKQYGNRDTTYLVLDKFSVQTVDYLTTIEGPHSCDRDQAYRPKDCVDNPQNKPYMQVDPEDAWLAAYDVKNGRRIYEQGLEPGMRVVFTESSIFDIKKFKLFHPNAALETETRNKFGQAVLAVYKIQ